MGPGGKQAVVQYCASLAMASMDGKALARWVGDQMYVLLGMQDKMIVQFLIDLATGAASADALATKLIQTDSLPDDSKTRQFADELYKVMMALCRVFWFFAYYSSCGKKAFDSNLTVQCE